MFFCEYLLTCSPLSALLPFWPGSPTSPWKQVLKSLKVLKISHAIPVVHFNNHKHVSATPTGDCNGKRHVQVNSFLCGKYSGIAVDPWSFTVNIVWERAKTYSWHVSLRTLLEDTDGETTFMVPYANSIIDCLCSRWWICGRGEPRGDGRAFQMLACYVGDDEEWLQICSAQQAAVGEAFWEEDRDLLEWFGYWVHAAKIIFHLVFL